MIRASGLTRPYPLKVGIIRRQFPSLRGTKGRNNGVCTWHGSRYEYHIGLLSAELRLPRPELKNFMLITWLRPTCRGLLPQWTRASGSSKSNPEALKCQALTSWSHADSCIVRANPSIIGLNLFIAPLFGQFARVLCVCLSRGDISKTKLLSTKPTDLPFPHKTTMTK